MFQKCIIKRLYIRQANLFTMMCADCLNNVGNRMSFLGIYKDSALLIKSEKPHFKRLVMHEAEAESVP